MVHKPFLISFAVSLLWVFPTQAREGKVFFNNGRWLKGDIQIQKESSGKEIVAIALKSGTLAVDRAQVKNIVYPVRSKFPEATADAQAPQTSNEVSPLLKTGNVLSSNNLNAKPVPTFSPVSPFEHYIQEASAKNQLDPKLVKAVIQQESNFKTNHVSRKGAKGLMQLMPETAKILGVQDLFDPRENIHAGTRYLRTMLEHFHWDIEYALAAYNAGPGAVKKYGAIPPYQETQDYVRKVLTTYRSYLNGTQLVAFMDKKGKLVITDLPYLP